MGPIAYLFLKQMKNRLLSLKKKPGLLITYIFMLLIFISSIALTITGEQINKGNDGRIVYLFLAGFGVLYIITFVNTGLSTGSTLFNLSDVGLLFVAPISPKKILNYGILNSLGRILVSSIFLIYQMSNLKTNFGYGIREIMSLIIIFLVMVFSCQLMSIAIYIYTNLRENRKKIIKAVLYVSILALLASVLIYQRNEQCSILQALLGIVGSKWFGFFPLAGWPVMFVTGIIEGSLMSVVISSSCFAVFIIIIIALFLAGKADYYEDVLLSTEITHAALMASKEGKVQKSVINKAKVKVKATDETSWKGQGAASIFSKHRIEVRRESRVPYIGMYTIFLAVLAVIATYNMKDDTSVYFILGGLIYLQYIMSTFGRLKQELQKHYIYLIPIKSSLKVFYASLTSIYKQVIDAVIIFTAMALTGKVEPLTCLIFALTYISSGTLFIAMTILSQRLLKGQLGMSSKIIVGMILVLFILMPGIILTMFVAFVLAVEPMSLSIITFIAYCLLISFVIFLLSGNLIDKSEYDGR